MSIAGIFADQNYIRTVLRGEGWDIEFHKAPDLDRFDWTARDEAGCRVSGHLTGRDFDAPAQQIVDRLLAEIRFELDGAKATERATLASVGAEEIEHRFGFHKATIEGHNATLPMHRDVRLLFRKFAEHLDELMPDGRAKRLAFTHLEDASMWSHKAIAETAPVVGE